MLHHPHLHCLIPAGGLSLDRSRWVPCRRRFFLPVKVLGSLFRGKFLAFLAAAYRKKKLDLLGSLAPLQNSTEFDRFLARLRNLHWVVYAKPPFGGPEHVIKYPARYTHRVAISNGRLLEIQDGQVTFRWRDSTDGNQQKRMMLDAVEFIRRFLLHVLPSGFVKIRHYGFLTNRNRRKNLVLCRSLLPKSAAPATTFLTEIRQRAIERKCPFCKTGTLHVVERIPPGTSIPFTGPAYQNTS
jgi:hypothetical protein